jgi:hypothetical protein
MVMKISVVTKVIIMLFMTSTLYAGVSLVKNGSFEADGRITDITQSRLTGWCDVNVPEGKFVGRVTNDWFTNSYYDGDGNSLYLYSVGDADFAEGDMAAVSQNVYLTDVNELTFDLKLTGTHSFYPWDSENFVVVILVDGNEVWNSSVLLPQGNAEHLGVVYEVDEFYKDPNMHSLTFAMKAASTQSHFFQYKMWVDFARFDTHCGGFGYLDGDMNHDCYVDANDYEILALLWLGRDPNYHDLYGGENSVFNMGDYSILAADWQNNTWWENWGQDNCYIAELVPYDIDDSGIVGVDDVNEMGETWLTGGSCVRGDLNGDGIVNFIDYAMLFDQWGRRSWLYGL